MSYNAILEIGKSYKSGKMKSFCVHPSQQGAKQEASIGRSLICARSVGPQYRRSGYFQNLGNRAFLPLKMRLISFHMNYGGSTSNATSRSTCDILEIFVWNMNLIGGQFLHGAPLSTNLRNRYLQFMQLCIPTPQLSEASPFYFTTFVCQLNQQLLLLCSVM